MQNNFPQYEHTSGNPSTFPQWLHTLFDFFLGKAQALTAAISSGVISLLSISRNLSASIPVSLIFMPY
jgi:hypothetical protein